MKLWKLQKNLRVTTLAYLLLPIRTTDNEINWDYVMEDIHPKISDEVNSKLIEPFIVEEVRNALFQLHPDKDPGIDEFSALFYQKFWDIIKDDICDEVLNFLNHDLDPDLNTTVIVLLRKKEISSIVEDCRPISLCNVVMKVNTKSLANWLNEHLPMLISPN